MPLVLSLQQDHDFYVGSDRFVVSGIVSNTEFDLLRARDGKTFRISDLAAAEVKPGVMVSAGRQQGTTVKAVIAAPSDVLVLRGEKFRNRPAGPLRRRA